MAPTNLSVVLVQQGVWSMDVESMPLAAGYLKAFADSDPEISARASVRILNLNRQASAQSIVRSLVKPHVPDIIGFSVLGWNYHSFGKAATTIKQISPETIVVFGGNHVTGQAEKTFTQYPAVDIIVNGEGELTFREIIRHHLAGSLQENRASIFGISYQVTGAVETTAARSRLSDLSIIPSPFLTGSIPLKDARGNFRYDVALMETNRGCPYKCAFCYWGGAIAQRVRTYPRERLRAELELFAEHAVETIALCDANFGMLPSDIQFVRDLLDVRDSHGYPVALECSWAKNKSKTFRSIVEEMSRRRLKSSFTIALQTLDEKTLDLMNRRNMRINDWQQLADWLDDLGFACYAELIWGAPGETVESFLAGYDKLTERIGRIATYPLILIPNTHFYDQRDTYGFVTVQGDHDDFEYVVANRGISLDDTWSMSRFMFWSRLLSEHAIIRNAWCPARLLAELKQSDIIRSVADWFAEGGIGRDSFDRLAVQFGSSQVLSEALTLFHTGAVAKNCSARGGNSGCR